MGRPKSGISAPKGRESLIDRFGGSSSQATPRTAQNTTPAKKVESKPTAAPAKTTRSKKETPAKAAPAKETPAKAAPAKKTPVKESPKKTPKAEDTEDDKLSSAALKAYQKKKSDAKIEADIKEYARKKAARDLAAKRK